MLVKAIENESEYEGALREIDQLMDAMPNTPEGDRLDLVATWVEAWEKVHHPIDPPQC